MPHRVDCYPGPLIINKKMRYSPVLTEESYSNYIARQPYCMLAVCEQSRAG